MSVHFLSQEELRGRLPADTIIVSDAAVQSLWPQVLPGHLTLEVPPGESSKSWNELGALLSRLAQAGATRSTTVAALGGGVTGDLVGFAAAAYMRGIALIQIPTTLLAMVDSSVGGKVGIDLPEGKNLAGAFWPAKEVYISLEFLSTLPHREWLCGAAEVWKYGSIMDASFFETLEDQPIGPQHPDLDSIISHCVRLKEEVVAEDPEERTGRRAILNFGHTLAHAVETATGYSLLSHGEAVAIGMVFESRLGESLGATEQGTTARIEAALTRQGLPTRIPQNLDPGVLLRLMARDKKKEGDGLAFSLLTRVGECKLVRGVGEAEVSRLLSSSCA